MKTKTIKLTEKELKLLLLILEESEEQRSDMGCNDPYNNEKKIFTKEERVEMQKYLDLKSEDDDDEVSDGWLFNSQYVDYIADRIKEQIGIKLAR